MSDFTDLITTSRGGQADKLASLLLPKLILAVREYGGKASLILKVDIALMKDGDGEITIDPKIKAVFPEIKIPTSIRYADDKGRLSNTDPRQGNLLPDRTETERNDRQREQNLAQVGRGDVIELQANR